MDLMPKQEATAAIKEAQKLLLTTKEKLDGDSLGSFLALGLVLKKIGKEVILVSSGAIPEHFSFLPKIELIKKEMDGIKDFIVLVDEDKAKVNRLSYKLEDGRLKIVISPKAGNFSPQNVSFAYGDYHYDLIIILGAASFDDLGEIYRHNTEMFYKTDTLNIDHQPANSYFGKINWLDESASSTCEILVSLIEALESSQGKIMDEEIATSLLTGIMSETNLFQNPNTSSKSLTVAAQLVASGADRELIAKKVFQTHSYSTLKIWGKILSKLDSYPALGLVWSEVAKIDLDTTGANDNSLSQALDSLLCSTEGVKIAALFVEKNGGVKASLRSSGNFDLKPLIAEFNGRAEGKAISFEIAAVDLNEAKQIVLGKLKDIITAVPNPQL